MTPTKRAKFREYVLNDKKKAKIKTPIIPLSRETSPHANQIPVAVPPSRDVTLLRALRPDVGGWVTLSPRYWAGVPSDGGRAPYSAVLDKDLSWSSKLVHCLSRQDKRICSKAETSQ